DAGGDDDAHPDGAATDAAVDGGMDATSDGAQACVEAGANSTTMCNQTEQCPVANGAFCCYVDGCYEAGAPCQYPVLCDDSADCAGRGKTCDICCGSSENGHVAQTYCAPSCNPGEDQLCDPSGDDCPAGKTCRPSDYVSPYYACK